MTTSGSALHEITTCEVCGNTKLVSALDLGKHPLCDDLVAVGDTRVCREYPIDILFCEKCLTAHQHYQVPKQELFPHDYHYRARHTADVLSGMRDLADRCAERLGDFRDKAVLDIGCNDGSLLSIFAEKGAHTFGIEPTDACADAVERGHTMVNAYLTPEIAQTFADENGKPDLITFTNVFAHIENLGNVIKSLQALRHEGTAIVIENHYFGAILDRNQFDTFYHEHPRTYSYRSFVHIGEALGMKIGHVDFPSRYNGNIRIFYVPQSYASLPAGLDEDLRRKEQDFGPRLAAMGPKIAVWQERKRAEIEAAVKAHGPLRAKAFPGRAAIPLKLLGLDTAHIEATHEKPLSAKIAHYIPGTRIPIRSDDEWNIATEKGPVLNLAWHIAKEIHTYMNGRGYSGSYIDIISADDFA